MKTKNIIFISIGLFFIFLMFVPILFEMEDAKNTSQLISIIGESILLIVYIILYRCPYCGRIIRPYSKYCPYCGEAIKKDYDDYE